MTLYEILAAVRARIAELELLNEDQPSGSPVERAIESELVVLFTLVRAAGPDGA